MAAGVWTVYQNAKLALTQSAINLASGANNIACVLVTSGYTPAANTHSTYADISSNEASGTGYSPGGQIITSETDTASGGTVTFTSAAVSWTSSTVTAKYAVLVYRASAGTAAGSDKLICYVDLNSGGGSVATTAATFTITMNASGILTLT
jgi:hypothetical protein